MTAHQFDSVQLGKANTECKIYAHPYIPYIPYIQYILYIPYIPHIPHILFRYITKNRNSTAQHENFDIGPACVRTNYSVCAVSVSTSSVFLFFARSILRFSTFFILQSFFKHKNQPANSVNDRINDKQAKYKWIMYLVWLDHLFCGV